MVFGKSISQNSEKPPCSVLASSSTYYSQPLDVAIEVSFQGFCPSANFPRNKVSNLDWASCGRVCVDPGIDRSERGHRPPYRSSLHKRTYRDTATRRITETTCSVPSMATNPRYQGIGQFSDINGDESADEYNLLLKPGHPTISEPIIKSNKACETCRNLKIACVIDEGNPGCRRCIKDNQRCIKLPLGQRRKKRTDARLADLEDQMTIVLKALEQRDQSQRIQVIDLVGQGIMEADTAYRLFELYREEMSPMFPFVVFSTDVQPEMIRSKKPLLFLAILTVAAGILKPQLHHYLTTEVWKVLADRVLCSGKASIQVVQALLVMTVWYAHHQQRDDYRNLHHLSHSAAIMAMDAGMGRRVSGRSLFNDPWEDQSVRANYNSAEVRRTWLGVYHECSL